MRFSMQVSLLVDATGGRDHIMLESGGSTDTIAEEGQPLCRCYCFLDELVRHEPSRKVWDKLVFPPPLSEESAPRRSQHLGHILGCIVDLGNSMPTFRFRITELDSEFIGVMRGLLFEGHLLTYDPTYNVTEWVPVHGMVGNLSPAED